MLTRRYNLINNIGGWVVFIIALVTYWLTLEPTASYWDCGEFIIQADKLEVGHPPGNPIFMLTARFFANFASSPETVSLMVNAMSGLLSALTILLMFWTLTHLVRRLVVKDGGEISLTQMLIVMGSAAAGSLVYCWSDTFWFSAVEGEVYAFSSFCTALVFWLILKWENRADMPGSDRYLILIAYVIGISVAVHLLNLLCIPAIVLVFCYRKWPQMGLAKSLVALLVSFAIIALVLYGLVPGFIKVAQQFELFFVNTVGLSFNSGALIYAVVTMVLFVATLVALDRSKNLTAVALLLLLSATMSGMFFFGDGPWVGIVLTLAFIAWLARGIIQKSLPRRVLGVCMWSVAVIFVGYSSYALILIRSTADTPMNQNSPDNVFALASYLNREQYGKTPLIYGETLYSGNRNEVADAQLDTITTLDDGTPVVLSTPIYDPIMKQGKANYAKGIKGATPANPGANMLTVDDEQRNKELAASGRDYYVKTDNSPEPVLNPELNMVFPRIHSSIHRGSYAKWVPMDTTEGNMQQLTAIDKTTGDAVPELDVRQQPYMNEATGQPMYPLKYGYRPTQRQNLQYFLNYQLNHMYMRYFMWNFAGRQNDILNQNGEMDAGNWISGIPFIDNARLGDQSYLPDDLGKNNAGHNVYYMLPLLLGIVGLLWQAFAGARGIRQFWVIFFLFFMTGIAIVLYLNQPPDQPRERDYAFAGSFYAFAIWVGMGVAGLWRIFTYCLSKGKTADALRALMANKNAYEEPEQSPAMVSEPKEFAKTSLYCAAVALCIGILVPIQMVSQTWDDHDRSGRYAARDFGANYLESLEPNAIIFCNGDNDTFPLWYAQEVEGVRPDVKIVNLSYLASDWYANQQRMPSYKAAPVKMTAEPADYAYNNLQAAVLYPQGGSMPLLDALKKVYKEPVDPRMNYPVIKADSLYIPVDRETVIKRGLVTGSDTTNVVDRIVIDLNGPDLRSRQYLTLGDLLMLDIIATNAANGWERPIYWASTVGNEYHVGLTDYMRATGMAYQLVPTLQSGIPSRADRAYDVITRKYRWGGADVPAGKAPYFDETAARMLTSTRMSMLDLVQEFIYMGDKATKEGDSTLAADSYKKALKVLDLMTSKLPASTFAYSLSTATTQAQLYCELGGTAEFPRLHDKKLTQKGLKLLENLIDRYAQYVVYNQRMAAQFIQPSLTVEAQLIPYQFYHFIDLYTRFGGNLKPIEARLKAQGISLDVMKKNYDAYNGSADPAGDMVGGDGSGITDEQMAKEIAKYAEVVNTLAAYTPEEYAAASEEERTIDSLFYDLVEYYRDLGGDIEALQKYDQVVRVDMARSKRIGDEYAARHPELRDR